MYVLALSADSGIRYDVNLLKESILVLRVVVPKISCAHMYYIRWKDITIIREDKSLTFFSRNIRVNRGLLRPVPGTGSYLGKISKWHLKKESQGTYMSKAKKICLLRFFWATLWMEKARMWWG